MFTPDAGTKRYWTPAQMEFTDTLSIYFISPSKVIIRNVQQGKNFTYAHAFSNEILFTMTQV